MPNPDEKDIVEEAAPDFEALRAKRNAEIQKVIESAAAKMGPNMNNAVTSTDLLIAALKAARPYVHAFAENAPPSDGGAEAEADLEAIDAALAAANQ